jgi:23S rRNA (adenine2503-C2)-methyltransferase
MTAICDLDPDELAALLPGEPAFRSRQIWRWLARGVHSFDEMANLPKALRERLNENFVLSSCAVAATLPDADQSVKLQIRLEDNVYVECVLLSDSEGRQTACLSTQAGCPVGCVFCKTGSLGFRRNLTAAEIIEQFLFLRDYAASISNIVFMGMGEPFFNRDALRKTVALLTSPDCFGLSGRRITISTSGVAQGIRALADEGLVTRLAVSLTTGRPDLRAALMPGTAGSPLPALKAALVYWQKKSRKRLTLEAALLGGINTTAEDARAFADFASGLDCLVNLIPWNPVEGLLFNGAPLREPSTQETRTFTAALEHAGLKVEKRRSKGRRVNGACGQLGAW